MAGSKSSKIVEKTESSSKEARLIVQSLHSERDSLLTRTRHKISVVWYDSIHVFKVVLDLFNSVLVAARTGTLKMKHAPKRSEQNKGHTFWLRLLHVSDF